MAIDGEFAEIDAAFRWQAVTGHFEWREPEAQESSRPNAALRRPDEAARKPMMRADAPMPVKQPLAVSSAAPDAEYLALAQELGFSCPAMLQARLEAFFAEQFIEVYPLE